MAAGPPLRLTAEQWQHLVHWCVEKLHRLPGEVPGTLPDLLRASGLWARVQQELHEAQERQLRAGRR